MCRANQDCARYGRLRLVANTIFHDKDEPKKQYAIDFWLKPEGDKLTLMDIRVQKGPKQDGDSWMMVTRMLVAWWWLPVQEHPGDMEVTRAWQIMSAIHSYIATHKDANDNIPIKDDKTGETLPLQFVEIHQPVSHLKKEANILSALTSASRAAPTNITTSISG